MVKPIPDNVKDILGQLPGPQQVALKTYIASLRSEINELREEILASKEDDPHAHYHGGEKCTLDHGHADAEHKHAEGGCDSHDHKHGHDHKCDEHMSTDHGEHAHEHKHKEHKEHSHEHKHKEHKEHSHEHKHKEHSHDNHDHGHKHGHDEGAKEEVPAWKKAASNQDASAAPFGGSWGAEASVDASKMEE